LDAVSRELGKTDFLTAEEWLKTLDNRLHLVMVAERMEESLLALAHLLCWPLRAMAAPDKNVRKEAFKEALSEQHRRILRGKQKNDESLFSYARSRLDRGLREVMEEERTEESLRELRRLKEEVEKACQGEGIAQRAWSSSVEPQAAYRADVAECARMGMTERNLVSEVRRAQTRRFS